MALTSHYSYAGVAFVLLVAAFGGPIIAVFGDASAAFAAPVTRSGVHPHAASVAEASQRFGIPELWIWRVMDAESGGNARAVSSAGAMGLMQIMPATWAILSEQHRLGADPFDARPNILAGAAYLRAMWDRYRDIALMLAAYNAGPGRVDAFVSGQGRLPAETIAYVARIAPELGASGLTSHASAPIPNAADWQRSTLFAPRSNGIAAGTKRAAIMRPEPLRPSAETTDAPPGGGSRHTLFFPLSRGGSR